MEMMPWSARHADPALSSLTLRTLLQVLCCFGVLCCAGFCSCGVVCVDRLHLSPIHQRKRHRLFYKTGNMWGNMCTCHSRCGTCVETCVCLSRHRCTSNHYTRRFTTGCRLVLLFCAPPCWLASPRKTIVLESPRCGCFPIFKSPKQR